jgi:hypothetical protein
MRRFRLHLGTLMIILLFLGVGFAALRESNEIWDRSIFSIMLGVLLISILLAIHRTERRRAFWLGFAVFGWIYLALTLIPSIESRLMTTEALAYLDSKVPGRQLDIVPTLPEVIQFANDNRLDFNRPDIVTLAKVRLLGGSSATTANFVRIGHSLFALLAGWLGGQLSRHLSRNS